MTKTRLMLRSNSILQGGDRKKKRWKLFEPTSGGGYSTSLLLPKSSLDHLLWFLQQSPATIKRKHGTNATVVSVLVSFKANEINEEYKTVVAEANLAADLPPEFYDGLVGALSMSHAEYQMRVMDIVMSLPYQLMWMVEASPTCYCEERVRVAKLVVAAQVEDLDNCTAKLRYFFPKWFLHAAEHGTLHENLWDILNAWKQEFLADVGFVESGNSVLTKMTGTAVNIDIPLLASRFTTKKKLLEGGEKPDLAGPLAACLTNYR